LPPSQIHSGVAMNMVKPTNLRVVLIHPYFGQFTGYMRSLSETTDIVLVFPLDSQQVFHLDRCQGEKPALLAIY
jgi:hypothetical protein